MLVAGCGGSKSTSSATTPAPPSTTSQTTSQTSSQITPPATTATTTTRSQTPSSTTTKTTTTSATATTGSINVRVPARFTILPDGSVTPRTITIPAHLPVELIVVSNGGAHRVTLRRTTLTVRAHAQAEALIDGFAVGGYPLDVDGAVKAVLMIGGAPGP